MWILNLKILGGVHEDKFLKLDCTKIKEKLDIKPRWDIETAMEKIVEFEKAEKGELKSIIEKQIAEY